jgi:hypothetical protein
VVSTSAETEKVRILKGRFVAPKCMRSGCAKRTKSHQGGRCPKFQLGTDGKKYRLYCSCSCRSKATYYWTEKRAAAARRVSENLSSVRWKRNCIHTLTNLLKPYTDNRELIKVVYEWGLTRRRAGVEAGVRQERTRLSRAS